MGREDAAEEAPTCGEVGGDGGSPRAKAYVGELSVSSCFPSLPSPGSDSRGTVLTFFLPRSVSSTRSSTLWPTIMDPSDPLLASRRSSGLRDAATLAW